ncbi:hypothetical protein GM3709_2528 [Geminocystis sp. NIES-3709]|nr:hypothetical protein GM3709_2528 [Geminocystis sp. NIES-3709]
MINTTKIGAKLLTIKFQLNNNIKKLNNKYPMYCFQTKEKIFSPLT